MNRVATNAAWHVTGLGNKDAPEEVVNVPLSPSGELLLECGENSNVVFSKRVSSHKGRQTVALAIDVFYV